LAKNLKLNIKNTQLAEALKLGKAKLPATAIRKKKAVEKKDAPEAPAMAEKKEVSHQEPAKKENIDVVAAILSPAPFVEEPAPAPKAIVPPKAKEVVKEAPRPSQPLDNDDWEEKKPLPAAAAPEQKAPVAPSPAPAAPRPPFVPRQQGTNPPYQSRPPYNNQERRPYPDQRPPYQDRGPQQSRPPYQDRGPQSSDRPYQDRGPYQDRSGGARPPYNSSRPPFTRPPGGPGGSSESGAPRREFNQPFRSPSSYRPGGPPQSFRPSGPMDQRKGIPPKGPVRSEPSAAKKPTKAFGDDPAKKGPGFKEFRDLKTARKPDVKRAFDSRDRQGLRSSEDEEWRKRRPSKTQLSYQEEIIRPKSLNVRLPITIKDLASEMKLKASQLISKLFMQGVVVTLNDYLADETTVQLIGHDFDCQITIDTREEERLRVTDKTIKQEVLESDSEQRIIRPPVITFMGHVDHGKTSLIDAIRKTNVAAGEAGAITQHIGAFKCHTAVGDITILDTPGHEAFSAMRTRGADVTDIVVLVIAGDEGIRTQTVEAIKQAQDAKVPMIVALNKSDKPNFNPENVYRQLGEHELLPEAWGGSLITVNCSATTGAGIKELLEMLALQAEILELHANPHQRARGTVIESEMHKGLGAVATILVQNGTLRLGDAIVFGQHWARIKTMHDEKNKEIKEAGPSTPVKITGLSGLPEAGSEFIVVKDEREARELSYGRSEGHKHQQLQQTKKIGIENVLQQKAEMKEKKTLTVILRADVQGSLEALKNSLEKISSTKVDLNVISSGIGEISESDIQLAAASKATIIGFHTGIEAHAEPLIKQQKVIVKTHDIIYHAVDDVRALMRNLLDKIAKENDTGTAVVKAIFKASQIGVIAGCQITDGTIKRNNHVRVMRDNQMIWKGSIASLKRVKDDVREVSKGMECGILLQNFNELKEGDILNAYEITYLEQEI
jgi:translation initiation factor IF-2